MPLQIPFKHRCSCQIAQIIIAATSPSSLHTNPDTLVRTHTIRAMAATIPTALAVHKDAPDSGRDSDKDERYLAGTVVCVPTRFVDSQLLLLGCDGAVRRATDGGDGPFCASDGRVRRNPANVAYVDVHETIDHIAGPTGVVEWNHVRGAIVDDIGEVASALVDSCWLALEYPVFAWGPGSGSAEFEASATIEGHTVDQFFGTEVVTDEISVAGEEQNGHVREEIREEVYGGDGILCSKGVGDDAVAFDPTSLFFWVDVEGFEHVFAAEVGGYAGKVRRPAHPAGWIRVSETNVVHIHADLVARWAGFGMFDNALEDLLAYLDIDVTTLLGDGFHTNVDFLFKREGGCAVRLEETLFVGEGEVCIVMCDWVDPAVADEEALNIPFGLRLNVAIENSLRDVGDVLAGVRFAGDVDLARVRLEWWL